MITHFDLFSGIGGFALAAKWAGFETTGFSEVDPFCNKVLKKNFPHIENLGNIKNIISPGKVNLITAGLPCQPFSQAGNKKGKEDERYLWAELYRIIQSSKPDWIIIENVYGFISVALDDIVTDLAIEGYFASVYVLPACCANAPHRRDRVWIIAYHNSNGSNDRLDYWWSRCVQKNIDRYVAQVQPKWTLLQPYSWAINTARDWLDLNTAASRRNDGVCSELDKRRIKALGNAIVPQVIYPIMQFIRDSYE